MSGVDGAPGSRNDVSGLGRMHPRASGIAPAVVGEVLGRNAGSMVVVTPVLPRTTERSNDGIRRKK